MSWTKVLKASIKFKDSDYVDYMDQIEFQDYFCKQNNLEEGTIYFDGEECVDAETGKTIPGADLGQTYKKMSDAIKKYFKIK